MPFREWSDGKVAHFYQSVQPVWGAWSYQSGLALWWSVGLFQGVHGCKVRSLWIMRRYRNQLLFELHVLLNAEGVLLLKRGEVAEGHQGAGVPEVVLERLGVPGLA